MMVNIERIVRIRVRIQSSLDRISVVIVGLLVVVVEPEKERIEERREEERERIPWLREMMTRSPDSETFLVISEMLIVSIAVWRLEHLNRKTLTKVRQRRQRHFYNFLQLPYASLEEIPESS